MASPSAVLSQGQLALLAEHGEERSAEVGDVLFKVGDRSYPLIAIIEGEAAILDAAGEEIIRHGPSGFLGETNLLSGQTVYLTAVVTKPMRYIAVEREDLKTLLFEDGPLSDLLLSTFVARREGLQSREGVGMDIIGPQSSDATRRMVDFARRNRLPANWLDTSHAENVAAIAAIEGLRDDELPLVRLPGGPELRNPTPGEVSRALGVGLELAPREEVDLVVVGGGPAGLGAAVYGASEGLDTLVVEGSGLGGQAGTSRRIENYLGFPAGISGSELTARAITQARKFGARTATPYRALALEPGDERHLVRLEGGHEVSARAVVLATGADYRRLPVADVDSYEGVSIFYAAGPQEAQQCGATRVGVVGGGNSAAQAAIWLARGGALVTLLHRRADLSETMSDYLIHDLDRAGVAVRGTSEIVELHGSDGRLEAATLRDGERIPLSYLFLFLGAVAVLRVAQRHRRARRRRLRAHRAAAGAESILETSAPGIFAVGDIRSGRSSAAQPLSAREPWSSASCTSASLTPIPVRRAQLSPRLPGAQVLIRRGQRGAELLRSAPREVRVAQQLPGEQDHVRLARSDDRISLPGSVMRPDRAGRDARLAADSLGERHLVARRRHDLLVPYGTSRRDSIRSTPRVLSTARELDALVDVPAALGPVGGRDPHQQRQLLGPDGANLVDDLEQQPSPVLEPPPYSSLRGSSAGRETRAAGSRARRGSRRRGSPRRRRARRHRGSRRSPRGSRRRRARSAPAALANGTALGATGCQPPSAIASRPPPRHGASVPALRPACASCIPATAPRA